MGEILRQSIYAVSNRMSKSILEELDVETEYTAKMAKVKL